MTRSSVRSVKRRGRATISGYEKEHCAAAVKVLADLDAEHKASGEASGEQLSWTTADVEMREMLATSIDRRGRALSRCARRRLTLKLIAKLSNEIRQLNTKER